MTRCIKPVWLLSGLLAAFILTGCIIVGTFVIDFEINDPEPVVGTDDIYHFNVDLTTDDDWEDHKDKIKDIDNVGFVLAVTNNELADIEIIMYIDDVDDTPFDNLIDIEDNTTQVLQNVVIAADGQTIISWPTSLTKVMNIGTLKTHAESGSFGLYVVASEPDLDFVIDFAVVAVTVTAGE